MRSLTPFLSALAILFVAACGSSNAADPLPQRQPRADFPPGQVQGHVKTFADSTQAYAVYLPKNYTPQKAWGAMYFFDSHGRGELPVKKYMLLADMYELVLVGSHNSRNGQQPAQGLAIFDALVRDTREKLNLDSNRVYTAGFSGGARVAAMVAQNRPQVVGVAGCGAGFQPRPQDKFAYMGLVGTEDFNYQELRLLDETLDGTGVHHLIEYFTAGHEWPPMTFMAKAFQFLQMRSMAMGFLPRVEDPVEGMLVKYRSQDSAFAAAGQDFYRWVSRRKVIGYLEGLTDLTEIKASLKQLEGSAAVVAEKERLEAEFQRENALRQQYATTLQTAPVQYWEKAAPMLWKIGRHGKAEEAWLHMRIINFLSLNAYMLANGAFQQGDLAGAERYVALYALIDPPNSETAYLQARLAMRKNDAAGAMAGLNRAFDLGFRDWQRLNADPDFAGIRNETGFAALIQRMQTEPVEDKQP